MTEIDYERLAKDLASAYIGPRSPAVPFEKWWDHDAPKEAWGRVARSVADALRDQGLVVARAGYLGQLLAAYTSDQREWHLEHYGNTDDLDAWLDTPAIKHIKEVIGVEENDD